LRIWSLRIWLTPLLLALVVAALVAAVLAFPGEADLRRRAADEVERRYQVRVDIGRLSWTLWPVPVVLVQDIHTRQPEPIHIGNLRVTPAMGPLLTRGRLALALVQVDGARVPAASLRAFRNPGEQRANTPGAAVRQVRLRRLTWVSRTGVELPLAGNIHFDDDDRPARAEFWRPDFVPLGRLLLEREGTADRWAARVDLGGGTAAGTLVLHTRDDGLFLAGTLDPKDIDLESAAAALNRRTPFGGRVRGLTRVAARGETGGELGSTLRLRTEAVVDDALILRFDVDRALKTLGAERQGRTPLSRLTGVMDLQNTDEGAVIRYEDVVLEGRTFSAEAEGTVFNRTVAATGELRTTGGAVVLPFRLTGPTRDVAVSVPGEVTAGAIAGTLVLPVIGTLAGARLGAAAAGDEAPGVPPGTPRFEFTPLDP